MDKNAIKRYAIWARRELIEKVAQKALQYGIEEGKELNAQIDSVNGVLLSEIEKKQRQALISKISKEGYNQVIEEVAYTWFNRFIALRFMEVNGYLPSHVRVFTDENNNFKPQILSEALHLEIANIDKNAVMDMKQKNQDDELYKYLLILQCNDLNSIFPNMFQTISDYTELLLPDYLLREGSVIQQMVEIIPESDWTDQVQIIGWMYQYYNSEPKDDVFAALKKNTKITKENIPAATQLFTPDWIVRYMVENSLSRVCEGNIEDRKNSWKYLVEDAEQNETVKGLINSLTTNYGSLENLKCIDPCMGSGHILVYIFDVLIRVYEEQGYTARDAAALILKNNIYGLDLDERSAQLASFALMMKARQYDRRFFTKGVFPNVHHFKGLVLDSQYIKDPVLKQFVEQFRLSEDIGSLLNVDAKNICDVENAINLFSEDLFTLGYTETLKRMLCVCKILSTEYDVVCTNPPYMGYSGMNTTLSDYLKKYYPDSKADMYAVFIERCAELTKENGLYSMITQHSWMFLSSYENLRKKVYANTIICMNHLGARAFDEINGEVVQTTAFIIQKAKVNGFVGKFERLLDYSGESEKEKAFFERKDEYLFDQNECLNIPSEPLAYWISKEIIDCFKEDRVGDYFSAVKGLDTCDNDRYVRQWEEVDFSNIGFNVDDCSKTFSAKWYPYSKGGGFRKWYGFNEMVVNWKDDGHELRNLRNDKGKIKSRPQNTRYYFKKGLTWSSITSYKLSLRYMDNAIFGGGGSAMFSEKESLYVMALLNSKVGEYFLNLLNPTINVLVNDILSVPYIEKNYEEINSLVKECIALAKEDYDSFETSWDFDRHPLVPRQVGSDIKIEDIYNDWEKKCNDRFYKLKSNEERINEILIETYGLSGEINKDVEEQDIEACCSKANKVRDLKGLLSYIVGLLFGRYSIDNDGIFFAGGEFHIDSYTTIIPDEDGILPVCEDEYFSDDIVNRVIYAIKVIYGEKYLDDNLSFIVNAIGLSGIAREALRTYFTNSFYADHCKMYQKRPIYWMFSSGKNNGFQCLAYIHRYKSDTIARIRTDYVHELQSRYRTELDALTKREGELSVKEKRHLQTLRSKEQELFKYEENIHHLADQMIDIDLDNGVKSNYLIFKDVLAQLK